MEALRDAERKMKKKLTGPEMEAVVRPIMARMRIDLPFVKYGSERPEKK
jgi:hypothetical protein